MRKLFWILIFGFFASFLFASESQTQKLYLKNKIIVHSEEVYANDLFSWKSTWNPVLYQNVKSPLFLKPEDVSSRLNSASKESGDSSDWEVKGTKTLVLPLVKPVSAGQLETKLREYLQDSYGLDENQFRIHYEGSEIKIPSTSVELVWRRMGNKFHGGKRIFPLDLHSENGLIHSYPLTFVIEEKKEAWFAKRLIDSKQIITEDDVEKRSFFSSDSFEEYDLNNPIGKTALNEILTDKPIQKKQLRLLHMVERGQEVQLVYTIGNIMIKARSRALESGNEGDKISLLNITSNKKLEGKIQSPGICLLESE
ncbi:flagellar basal body P-ring formation chaperone FlgA [Leptospira ilyithenensis]|uniref:Flagellar basal body P-ring formation protein FlgA n=1 Tax=Leptospira ilyithenensis TaxID=2484901 RepID=A0A4R9LWN8_9LEPT|nr:flagellar basal body P-ring formation chaperone FlgA [Leptospira ilyithenensis]TGN13985.1 flagellar basal body P-ring formation protein FlgA [Leptospira ilyithenensis]